jgi:hypothetical protein
MAAGIARANRALPGRLGQARLDAQEDALTQTQGLILEAGLG